MEYECVISQLNNGRYKEKIDVPDETDPEEYVKQIVKKFNIEERHRKIQNSKYKVDIRKLVSVGAATGIIKCNLRKVNFMTVIRNGRNYDIMQCEECKMFYQRFGLPTEFYGVDFVCDPKRNCLECNKQFKKEVYATKHSENDKHKTPDWIPDGV